MTSKTSSSTSPARTLSKHEIDAVSGGMKWDRGHRSPNVIDARGGQFDLLGWRITLDINGKVSSAERI
jgi:hypothetical protein